MQIDEGHPIHYAAVERGTPVYSSDGVQVGTVDEVIDNYTEHILDGFVISTADDELCFVDAPEVARTAERAVTLAIDADEASRLPAPEKAPPRFRADHKAGRIGRLFGGGWKRQ